MQYTIDQLNKYQSGKFVQMMSTRAKDRVHMWYTILNKYTYNELLKQFNDNIQIHGDNIFTPESQLYYVNDINNVFKDTSYISMDDIQDDDMTMDEYMSKFEHKKVYMGNYDNMLQIERINLTKLMYQQVEYDWQQYLTFDNGRRLPVQPYVYMDDKDIISKVQDRYEGVIRIELFCNKLLIKDLFI